MAKNENAPTGWLLNDNLTHLALSKFRSTRTLINPYNPESKIFINHDLETTQSSPSYEFLLNGGVPKEDLDLALDQTNRLKIDEREYINPYSLSISELEDWVKLHVIKIYPLIDSSLNTFKNGFNEHGLPHAEEISRSNQNLLSGLGNQDQQVIQRSVIEALTHDLGNFISRENHEVASIFLLEKVLPELKTSLEQWRLIRKAILFHNIPFLKTLWDEDSRAGEKINILRDNLCPDTLVLILSDKTSIGRNRLTTKTIDRQSVNEDIHIALNLLVFGSHTGFSEDRQTFSWLIDFSAEPNLATDRTNINGLFFHHDGYPVAESLAFVPDAWHNNHRLYGIPHIASWYSSFVQTYSNRLELAILSSFALNPDQRKFEICVQEKVGEKSGFTIKEQIYKEDIDDYLIALKKKYLPKIARKKSQW